MESFKEQIWYLLYHDCKEPENFDSYEEFVKNCRKIKPIKVLVDNQGKVYHCSTKKVFHSKNIFKTEKEAIRYLNFVVQNDIERLNISLI